MKRVCAWCRRNMGAVHSGIQPESAITHGICEDCANNLFGDMGMKLTAFLDSLAAPVLLVDSTGSVKTANQQAQALLRKDLPDIEGHQPGDVFECVHAETPEGCGHTIHCGGCAIRRTVMDTFRSGKSHVNVPAFVNRGTSGDGWKVDLLISTEKVKDVVLLRIDEFG